MTINHKAQRILERVSIAIIMLAPSPQVCAQRPPVDLKEELRKGWSHLRALDEAECRYGLRYFRYDETTQSLRPGLATVRIDRKPGFCRETVLLDDNTDITAYNPEYFFVVCKSGDSQWRITRSTITESGTANPDIVRCTQVTDSAMAYYPLSFVYYRPGDVLLNDPTFEILNAAPTHENLMTIRIAFQMAIPELRRTPLHTIAVLTVDPAHHYCVLECRMDPSMGVRKNHVFNRTISANGNRIVCTRIESRLAAINYHNVTEFIDYDFKSTQDSRQYYLSYYGLPEPIGVVGPSRRSSAVLWMIVGGVAMLVAALYVRRYVTSARQAIRPNSV